MLTRSGEYPAKPSSRQNLVTVAGEVPARPASSPILIFSGACGLSNRNWAIFVMTVDISGSFARTRFATPMVGAVVSGV